LEVAFQTRALRDLCESEGRAVAALGTEVAASLRARLADMRAASSPLDLLAGNPRVEDDRIRVDLEAGASFVFSQNHLSAPLTDAGVLDWLRVRRIKLLEIRTP
jgi:hypothetical protein